MTSIVNPMSAKFRDIERQLRDVQRGGPGPDAAGTILAYREYHPATLLTYTSSSLTAVPLDVVNMGALQFVGPSTGYVVVEMDGLTSVNVDGNAMVWLVSSTLSPSTLVPETELTVSRNIAAHRARTRKRIAVTAGLAYEWTWAWRMVAGTGTILYGSYHGPISMSVAVG